VTDERPRPGPSTRANRAASRVPVARQVPTSVPIHQTATFASADAEEPAAALAGDQPGHACIPIVNLSFAAEA
jgi:O-acetylhomoserine/O-acetylserine sulfhydrylase-like pyridoxal-dependent enzyme